MSELDKKIEEAKAAKTKKPEAVEEKVVEESTLDFTKAVQHLGKIGAYLKQFEGQKGMNPFLWGKSNIEPLMTRFNSGERSKELFNAMMAIKEEEPSGPNLDPNQLTVTNLIRNQSKKQN